MHIADKLKQIGLNESEVMVYLDLLENGLSPPPIVSRRTNIARTNCYHVLNSLALKNLVKQEAFGKRKAYSASPPSSLIMLVEGTKNVALDAMPELEMLAANKTGRPSIRFYAGQQEFAVFFGEALLARSICLFASKVSRTGSLAYHFKTFESRALESTIEYSRVDFDGSLGFPTSQSGECSDILVWDRFVAILNYAGDGHITLIKSDPLAQTLRSVHLMIGRK